MSAGSASNSASIGVDKITIERDKDKRRAKVYLVSKPVEWQLPGFVRGPTYEHWGLYFQFYDKNPKTGEQEIVSRFAELTVDDDGRIDYNYGYLVNEYAKKFHVIDKLEDAVFVELSPEMVFEMAGENKLNGEIYIVGSKNCQDWVLEMTKSLGLSLNPSIKLLSDQLLPSIIANALQRTNTKKAANQKKNPFGSGSQVAPNN